MASLPAQQIKRNSGFATLWRFLPMLWPKGEAQLKARVIVAVLLVLAGKAATLLMPFAYKAVIDGMSGRTAAFGAVAGLVAGYATARFAGVLSDNLALLSSGDAAEHPPPRRFAVTVAVPDNLALRLRASDLVGELLGSRIPSSKIQLDPLDVPAQPPGEVAVRVTVDCHRTLNDTYAGTLSSADGRVSLPLRVAIDELGRPVS